MKKNGTKTSKPSTNPFAFLVEEVANTTYKVITDVAEGRHSVKCNSVDLLESNNGNPKVQFVFSTRKGGTVVDTIPLSTYADSLQAFNRLAYLLKEGQVEPESVTGMRQAFADILQGALGNSYEITSEIDVTAEIDESKLAGLTDEDAEKAISDHKTDLRKAYRADINDQKRDAYEEGFQIYEKQNRIFAITPDTDALAQLGEPLTEMFEDIVNKNCTAEVHKTRKYYNGRWSEFMNVRSYTK